MVGGIALAEIGAVVRAETVGGDSAALVEVQALLAVLAEEGFEVEFADDNLDLDDLSHRQAQDGDRSGVLPHPNKLVALALLILLEVDARVVRRHLSVA